MTECVKIKCDACKFQEDCVDYGWDGCRKFTPKLKRCPFCGGKADAWESIFCVWKVFCTECGANITLNTDENADVLWNRRVESDTE